MRSLSVVVGGACGALARWAVGLAIGPLVLPWATLIVNVSGAFGLGVAATLLTERLPPRRYLRTLLGVGFFGAYTTFSTMALEGVRLLDSGRVATAASYWMATFIGGQLAAALGVSLARTRRTT